ncbi:hypothetical protein SAMN05216389_108109 [Oceanobacillus limi]|uniref:Peptidyl-prolyl cis-trans isomerase n=1 Tax=Oceanobacillus limi TaxID=930131 RepID=A0A1I0DB68_9BACI|nr:hypothetical protein [Oceanobacillus limi]SET29540.1 hypothetical protein SAMN05216389_108109 [Oceanobacillus limi]
MIVPIIGNVTYSITMDPTVWIFDDRKIELGEAFSSKVNKDVNQDEVLEQAAKRWDREVYHQNVKPPVNKSISRLEGEKILTESYVMPIQDFINHAEIGSDAKEAQLITTHEEIVIPIEELKNSYFLFALEGKPLKEDGPVHLLYKDGSNQDNPIKGIQKINIL